MDVFKHPHKKIRLELSNSFDGTVINDDLWGADDITAEEFDMVEFQATQSHNQGDDTSKTSHQPLRNIVANPEPLLQTSVANQVSLRRTEEMKQQQYELEGKVKLLTQTVEKVSKDLKEEKLKRNKILNEKIQEFQIKENSLCKEIKKIESVLQFKNQEIKSVYDKVHLLESQLQEKKKVAEPSSHQTSNTFLKKFKTETPVQVPLQGSKPKLSRRHKLLVDIPQGKIQGTDIISSILCNKIGITPAQNPYFSLIIPTQTSSELSTTHCSHLSTVSIVRLGSDHKTEELFDYFICAFRNYLTYLKSVDNLNADSSANSPLSLRRKEANQDQAILISCLKDLVYVISSSQFLSLVQRCKDEDKNMKQIEMACVQSTSKAATNVISTCDKKVNHPKKNVHSLLKLLVSLAHPDTYPTEYLINDEIELSLTALVTWSSLLPESLIQFADEILLPSLIHHYNDVASLYLYLKLITNLCIYEEVIPTVTHKNDACLLCAIASLTIQKILPSPLKFTSVMLMVENFLSTLFTVHGFEELKLDSSPCSSLVLQGVITSLLKFHKLYQENNYEVTLILKKGFILVNLLSSYFPNFQERRAFCEHSYISLLCGMLTLSKENPMFKEFYDFIFDLWDFQEDTSEFDLDDPFEDSSQMVELRSQDDC